MITAGIDLGVRSIKVVLLKDNVVISKNQSIYMYDVKETAQALFEKSIKDANISKNNITQITATGIGADIMLPFVTKKISTICAIARGAVWFFPSAGMVIDVGAEEARVVKCDEKGNILDFALHDMCAAGTGTFLEAMAKVLELDLEQMGRLSLKSERTIQINAQCPVFAESEIVGLIHQNIPKPDIVHGVYDSIAERISSMVRRLGITLDIVVAGGVAKDIGFIESLKRKLKVGVLIPENPEFVGAIGAAISGV